MYKTLNIEVDSSFRNPIIIQEKIIERYIHAQIDIVGRIQMNIIDNIIGISKSEPASKVIIENVENEMNVKFPRGYRELLESTNGFSTDNGIVIYGTDDIVERNITLEVDEYAKGYLAVGDDSGDIVFIIAIDDSDESLLAVGCGDMNPANAKIVADNFRTWLLEGCDLSVLN